MAAQAFVSYAGEDREVAEAIAGDLTRLGVPNFYDRDSLKPGDSIVDRIHDALAQADFGILVVSPELLEKDWPQHETRQHRSELLARASEWITGDEATIRVTAADLKRLKELCNAELGFGFPIKDER
jgi:TIR domain